MVAWELRSRQTGAIVRCLIEEPESARVLMRITHDTQEIVVQWYSSRGEAVDRAVSIQADLLRHGWAEIGV